MLHVDLVARDKSGIAYQDKSRQPEASVDHIRMPHRQAATKWDQLDNTKA
jgi:hypothetical protein